jgi:hypothetical protein
MSRDSECNEGTYQIIAGALGAASLALSLAAGFACRNSSTRKQNMLTVRYKKSISKDGTKIVTGSVETNISDHSQSQSNSAKVSAFLKSRREKIKSASMFESNIPNNHSDYTEAELANLSRTAERKTVELAQIIASTRNAELRAKATVELKGYLIDPIGQAASDMITKEEEEIRRSDAGYPAPKHDIMHVGSNSLIHSRIQRVPSDETLIDYKGTTDPRSVDAIPVHILDQEKFQELIKSGIIKQVGSSTAVEIGSIPRSPAASEEEADIGNLGQQDALQPSDVDHEGQHQITHTNHPKSSSSEEERMSAMHEDDIKLSGVADSLPVE